MSGPLDAGKLVNSVTLVRFHVILMRFILLQTCHERINLSVAASHQAENGSVTTVSSKESEEATYAFLPPIESTDAHLHEFAEAMRSNNTNT